MSSVIKQRINEAKEELQKHIASEGVDVEPHKDGIEQMKDILEKDNLGIEAEQLGKEDAEAEEDPQDSEKKDFELESEQNKVESNLDELQRQLDRLESEELEEGSDTEMSENDQVTEEEDSLDRSHIASAGVNSELDLEPEGVSEPAREDFGTENDNEKLSKEDNGHTYREKDEGLEERLAKLEADVRKHEQEMVSEESEELSKVNDLENRIEDLELNNDSDLEQRIVEMENKIRKLESLEGLDDRLNEIEDQLIKEGSIASRIKEVLNEEVDQPASEEQVSEVKEQVNDVEQHVNKSLEEFDKKTERLWEMIEEVESGSGSVSQKESESLNSEVESLWEAMDEEMATIESRLHDDEQDMEELTSMVVELSELVKQKFQDH